MMTEDRDKMFIEAAVSFKVAAETLADNVKKLNDDFALHQKQADKMEVGINDTIKTYAKVIAALGIMLLLAIGGATVIEKALQLKKLI